MIPNSTQLEKAKYPLGRFVKPGKILATDIEKYIETLENLPGKMRREVELLSEAQLDTPYREGGWTIRQVTHHVPDSHLNAYCRFKLALTEEQPSIRPYMEDRWAELPDSKTGSIGVSLDLLELIHRRWLIVLRNMSESDFSKTYFHPENKKIWRLDESLSLYDWHSRHHLAHITELKKRMGWK